MINEKTKKELTSVSFYLRVMDIILKRVSEKHPEILTEAVKKALDEIEGDRKQ